MKKIKNSVLVAIAALVLVIGIIFAAGCGGTKLSAGTYEGTYTCEYTVGETSKWGYTATITVNDDNVIWDVQLVAPEGYTGGIGGRPWDLSKFTQQFCGLFTVDDVANIKVNTNEAGYPVGPEYVESGKDVLLLNGFEAPCAIAILAMQNAINEALA